MRTTRLILALSALLLLLTATADAFDGQRKGKILGIGFGWVGSGPHVITADRTTYKPGVAIRLVAGYATSNRSMFTFGIARQAIISTLPDGGKNMDGANWMLELSLTRYRREADVSTFWRAGMGLIDWGTWGRPGYGALEESRDFSVAAVGGVGYMFLRGVQAQLDIVAGPGPSNGGGLKGLIRLELVGIIY